MCQPIALKTCLASSTQATPTKKRPRVSFATVEVRSYPMILDDTKYRNPYLTMGWESFETSTQELPVEEESGSMTTGMVQRVPPKQRLLILLRAGYSAQSLREHLSKPDPDMEQLRMEDHCKESKMDSQPQEQQPKKIFSKFNHHAAAAC